MLRYTFPKEYNQYSITTRELGDTDTPIIVLRDGKVVYNGTPKDHTSEIADLAWDQTVAKSAEGNLVVQTAKSIKVDPVVDDSDASTVTEKYKTHED